MKIIKRMNKLIFSLLVLWSFMMEAQAGNAMNGVYSAYDRGQDACGQFLEARKNNSQENIGYAIWLAGYITAYNQLKADTRDLLNLSNSKDPAPLAGPMQWIENYCVKNPMDDFMKTVITFTKFQYPNRAR